MSRQFQQVPHQLYEPSVVAALVANDKAMCIALVLVLLGNWVAQIVDVKGTFLKHPVSGQ